MTAGDGTSRYNIWEIGGREWQAPWSEVQIPFEGRRNIISSATWVDKDWIEIRIFDREHEEALLSSGQWVPVKQCEMIPVAKLIRAKELIDRKIIEPLRSGVHTYDYSADRCHTCHMPSSLYITELKLGMDYPCPGWL